jgi:hypothetical protein
VLRRTSGAAQLVSLGVSTRIVKTKLTSFALIVGLLLIALAIRQSFGQSIFSTARDWQFVQSVGGLAIGTPHRDDRKQVILPIRCNITGTQTVTIHPTTGYSGLAFDSPKVHVHSTNVFITVCTVLPGKRDASCPPADLGKLEGGDYSVFYSSPDGKREPLGSIKVPSL